MCESWFCLREGAILRERKVTALQLVRGDPLLTLEVIPVIGIGAFECKAHRNKLCAVGASFDSALS